MWVQQKGKKDTVKETIMRLYDTDSLVGNSSLPEKETEVLRRNIMERGRRGTKMRKNLWQ